MNELIGRRVRAGLPLIALAVLALVLLALLSRPPAARAATQTVGLHGWQVQSSASAGSDGAAVSRAGFAATGWLKVAPDDGGAPGTEVEALVQNGRCANVFFSTNLRRCFGYMKSLGADTISRFAVPWWFRTTFSAQPAAHASLVVNGVVGEADLWINGHEVAGHSTLQGAYTQYVYDVSRLLRRGANALAFRLYPNDPNTTFTLDNVDWTQIPPDNNTGIQFPVQLHDAGALAISDVHVIERNAPHVTSSALTLRAQVTNTTGRRQSGVVAAQVTSDSVAPTPPTPRIRITHPVTVPAHSTRTVSLTPAVFHVLRIRHPQVWWPYQMTAHPPAQPLYGLTMSVGRQPWLQPLGLRIGDVRDPHHHDASDRPLADRAARVAPVPGQRQAHPVPGRRLVGEPVPALLRRRHRQSDRADQEPRSQRHPHRGQGDAR